MWFAPLIVAVTAVSDESLLPVRSDSEIKELISQAGWLGMREKNENKDEFTNSTKPNIWIDINEIEKENRYPDAIDEDINEPGVRIGLYFNTINAVRNAKNLLQSHNISQKEELLDALSCLDDIYQTRLRRKTKSYNYAQTPAYETILKFKTNQINDEKITELFEESDKIETEGKRKMEADVVSQEFPSLDLVYVKLSNDDTEFIKRIKEMFGIYKIVRNIKSKKVYDEEEKKEKEKITTILQEEFKNYVADLNKRKIPPEQWRELTNNWWKEHQN
ncbi:MAG: hypothetical protein ACREBH_00965 [Candidatus Micrarchaeaceae archaeon]